MDAPAIKSLREAFGFKRQPDDLGDGGTAFIAFLNFATGDSKMAHSLQAEYFNGTGDRPMNDSRATAAQTGGFIDWLIETQWGELPREGLEH